MAFVLLFHSPTMFMRLCAFALAVLAASPFTAPFATCDLSTLLPVAQHKVVHHRTYDTGRITAVDVHDVHVLPFKRLTGSILPAPIRTFATVSAATRPTASADITVAPAPTFQSPLRI